MARTRLLGKRTRWLLGLMAALVVSGAWLLSSWEQQSRKGQSNTHATEGNRAPVFTLPSQTGDPVALESYLGRQSVVLVFYMGDF